MPLFLTNHFKKRFESLPQKVRDRVRLALGELEIDPRLGKKLTGSLQGHYSWRVGKYRVLYMLQGNDIFAETVRHRKEVYR